MLPAVDIELLGHPKQVSTLTAPVAAEYVLRPQLVQTLAEIAPVDEEYFPAAHSVHAKDPFTALYLPATQATHGPPSVPV